jgi:proline dehydrogenase
MNLVNRLVVAAMPLVPRPLVRRIAHRYVAGETLEQALDTVEALNAEGCMATLDVLGEDVERHEETERTVAEYLRALDGIASRRVESNISVKLTALGLKIDPEHCRHEFGRIVEGARRRGNFVRIDMEDSSVTEVTIRIFEEAREKYEGVGLVLQSYLRRSLRDAARPVALRANVRVCKGIYLEPAAIAFQGREEIRDSYSSLVDLLLGEGCYVGIATHDPVLVQRPLATVARRRLPREAYEFQMLLGVAGELRRRLVSAGHRLRVYVPYGEAWEAYSMRRLKENPAIAGHVVKGLFHRELRPRGRPLEGE